MLSFLKKFMFPTLDAEESLVSLVSSTLDFIWLGIEGVDQAQRGAERLWSVKTPISCHGVGSPAAVQLLMKGP